jgi:hypothetical protein
MLFVANDIRKPMNEAEKRITVWTNDNVLSLLSENTNSYFRRVFLNSTFIARDEKSSSKQRYNVKIGTPIRREMSRAVSNENDTTDVMVTFGLGILKSSLYLEAIAEIPLLAKTTPP